MSELFCAGKAKKCMWASFHSSPLRDRQLQLARLFHLMEFCVMESSFRAQISKVQYPSSLAYIYVCLFKASTRLVQFVVPFLSQKESPWSSRCRNAKGAGTLTWIQLGESRMDVVYRGIILLPVSPAEGSGPHDLFLCELLLLWLEISCQIAGSFHQERCK